MRTAGERLPRTPQASPGSGRGHWSEGAQPPMDSRMGGRAGAGPRRWGFVLEPESGTAHPMRLFPRMKKNGKKNEAEMLPGRSLEARGVGGGGWGWRFWNLGGSESRTRRRVRTWGSAQRHLEPGEALETVEWSGGRLSGGTGPPRGGGRKAGWGAGARIREAGGRAGGLRGAGSRGDT